MKASKKDEESGGWTKVEKKGEDEVEEAKPKGDEDRMKVSIDWMRVRVQVHLVQRISWRSSRDSSTSSRRSQGR